MHCKTLTRASGKSAAAHVGAGGVTTGCVGAPAAVSASAVQPPPQGLEAPSQPSLGSDELATICARVICALDALECTAGGRAWARGSRVLRWRLPSTNSLGGSCHQPTQHHAAHWDEHRGASATTCSRRCAARARVQPCGLARRPLCHCRPRSQTRYMGWCSLQLRPCTCVGARVFVPVQGRPRAAERQRARSFNLLCNAYGGDRTDGADD